MGASKLANCRKIVVGSVVLFSAMFFFARCKTAGQPTSKVTTSFDHVLDQTVLYTCHCGWVDRSHYGTATVIKIFDDFKAIWDYHQAQTKMILTTIPDFPAVEAQFFDESHTHFGKEYTIQVVLTQGALNGRISMSSVYEASIFLPFQAMRWEDHLPQINSTALFIYQSAHEKFEKMQDGWITKAGHLAKSAVETDKRLSSFSEEDLVSDLLAFYAVTNHYSFAEVLGKCQPASVHPELPDEQQQQQQQQQQIEASKVIWENGGGVNPHWQNWYPRFHQTNWDGIEYCPQGKDQFPREFQQIRANNHFPVPGTMFRIQPPPLEFLGPNNLNNSN